MSNKYSNLFQPIKIGNMEVKNRIAMMPMGVFSPRLMNNDGSYSKDGADYYIERAKGGTGLIVTGLVPVVSIRKGMPCIVNNPETYVKNQKYLTEGIHKYGSKVVIQLSGLTGRAGAHGTEPVPAEIQNVWDPTKKNPGMTKEDIKQLIKSFAQGAYLAKKAGADGVEIHAVHEGYLLDQFVIASMNYRTDEYGGSLENRLRLPIEIVQAIKAECGKDFPVLLRFSVKSYIKAFNRGALPGEEFEEFGRDIEESKIIAKALQDAGYDALDCDNGSYDSWFWPHPPTYMPKACNLKDVREIKKVVDIPVICAGRFDDPELADKVIGDGEIDMMGMGRPLLADPYITQKFENGDLDNIRPCICCHQGCLGRVFQGKDISCALNPACGREVSYEIKKAALKKKVLVVGGGIGGMEAARVSALRGHSVDLYEKNANLGGVFTSAAAPDFKDDDKKLLSWYKKQIRDLKINVHLNAEVTEEFIKNNNYDEVFIATGAKERTLQAEGLEGDNVTYAIDTLLKGNVKGESVLIIGGGLTGCEIAYDLSKKGKKVTIIELSETILNVMGLSAANYNMLMELLDYYKVDVIKNASLIKYQDGTAEIKVIQKNYPNSNNRARFPYAIGPQGIATTVKLPVDHIVVSIGYISNNSLYEAVKGDNVYLIGDAKFPTNVMEAIWSAYEIAMEI
ncbi:2-enoate reductase [Clostridium carboxidivorans P7]|nr:FAD-dependent oxidoreductase [Clostridium carboxidivorans]AKN30008.1 2-enoate reductase [Clostridium carboxidivorans P7]